MQPRSAGILPATEQGERLRVCAIARAWIGTPYHHQARLKGIGADCTFFAAVYEEAGLIPHVPVTPYAPQAGANGERSEYVALISRYAREVDAPGPADVVMYWVGRSWWHAALVLEAGWPHLMHGDAEARAVVLARGDQGRLAGLTRRRFFSLWG